MEENTNFTGAPQVDVSQNQLHTAEQANRPPKRKHAVRRIVIGVVLAIVAALIVIGGLFLYAATYKYEGPRAVRIYVPKGMTDEQLCQLLTDSLGNKFGGRVYRLWNIQGGEIEKGYGSYVIEPGNTAISVSRRIMQGRQTPVKLTFNNLRQLSELAMKVASTMDCTPEEFMAACNTLLPGKGFDKVEEYAAAFMPDTYEFYWNTPINQVVEKLSKQHDKFWTPERLAAADSLGLTPVEVTTLASIVEEETNRMDERPTVARLYLNRLEEDMALQADPTVKYAVGDFTLKRVGGEQTSVESPYNTYRNKGLPPGPIRIVEPATIDQVLNAPDNAYLYMCARPDSSGYHDFTRDYKTHQANAKKYQAELDKRGITLPSTNEKAKAGGK